MKKTVLLQNLNIDLKIILLDNQNNYRTLKSLDNAKFWLFNNMDVMDF